MDGRGRRKPPVRRSRRFSIASVYAAALVMGATIVTFPSSSTVLRRELELGDTLYGAYFLPGLGLAITVSLLSPNLLRRWSLQGLFRFGLSAAAAGLLLMAASPAAGPLAGRAVLLAAMLLFGMGAGSIGLTANTGAIELFPASRSGALVMLHGMIGVGAAVWPMVVAACAAGGIWPVAPVFLALLILGVAVSAAGGSIAGLDGGPAAGYRPTRFPGRLWLRSIAPLLYGIGEGTFTAWVVVFLSEDRGLPLEEAAGALSSFWLAMTAGRLGSTAVVRWIGALPLTLVLLASMAVAFPLVSTSGGSPGALLKFAFAGASCSALFPLLLSLASEELPQRTPQVSALSSAAVAAGLAIGSFGVGPLRAMIGLTHVYIFSAAGPVMIVLLVLILARRPRKSMAG
ncbi:MAG: hypothetical protein GF355_01205 [Candidatus Eisenbacteria bacterium]|nr:hypothetical protein [Candidatus Eisenbacteria bacterium]